MIIIIVVILIEIALAFSVQQYLDYQITRANTVEPDRVRELLEQRTPKLNLEQYYRIIE